MDFRSGWEDRDIDVNGVRTHSIEAGRGETLVLIHGGLMWCSAELTYGAVIGPLSRHLHVVAVDNIGFGFTAGRGPQDYSAEAQGRFLIRFIRALGVRAHIGGNSHGGWLVQYIAQEAPELVKRIVIINSLNGTSPIPADYPLPETYDVYPTEETVREDLLRFYVNKRVVTDERVQRTLEYSVRNYEFARARRAAMGSTSADWNRNLLYREKHISEFAGELRNPILLTWSRENRGASPEDALRFYRRLHDAEFHLIANGGHHAHTEHPEHWSNLVAEFLRSGR